MDEKIVKKCECDHVMKVWTDDVVVNASQKNGVNTYTCQCPVCDKKSDIDIIIQD